MAVGSGRWWLAAGASGAGVLVVAWPWWGGAWQRAMAVLLQNGHGSLPGAVVAVPLPVPV